MSERLTRDEFCKVYVPMAVAGSSALEIGHALKLEGDDEAVRGKVNAKSSQIRAWLKQRAVDEAKRQGLDGDATKALVESATAKMPKLKTRTRTTEDFGAFLDDLLAECDTTPEEGDEESEG